MIERRFHRKIYSAAAVDGAVKTYARFAVVEVIDEENHRVVRITGKKPERERRIADELANYALGLTRQTAGGADAAR